MAFIGLEFKAQISRCVHEQLFVFGRKQGAILALNNSVKIAVNSRSHLLIETILSKAIYATSLKKNIFKINRKKMYWEEAK